MKFDLAALLSLSRPLRAGRGLAVAANSVCPFTAVVPQSCFDHSPMTSLLISSPAGRLKFSATPALGVDDVAPGGVDAYRYFVEFAQLPPDALSLFRRNDK